MGHGVYNNPITITKAIGIILMVIGHSGCPQLLFYFIYLFHMPLFFFCSGLFLKDITRKEDAFMFLHKKVDSLYIPFVKWSFLFLLLHNVLIYVGIYNSYYGWEDGSFYYGYKDYIEKMSLIVFTMHGYEELLGGFWFIRTLFISSMIVIASSMLFGSCFKYKSVLMCLFFLVLTISVRRFLPDNGLWHDISMGTFGAFFIMFGYIANQKYGILHGNSFGVVICCLCLFITMLYFKVEVKMECGYNKVIPYTFSAISGILLTFYFSYFLDRNAGSRIKTVLYYIGNHTFTILSLHFLCFRFCSCYIVIVCDIDPAHIADHPVINNINMSISPLWWIPYVIVGICVSLMLNWIWCYGAKMIRGLIGY